MRVSRLGVAKRWARDLFDVDPAKFLVYGALNVFGESPRNLFAILVKNTIRNNVWSPMRFERVTRVEDDKDWEGSTVSKTTPHRRSALRGLRDDGCAVVLGAVSNDAIRRAFARVSAVHLNSCFIIRANALKGNDEKLLGVRHVGLDLWVMDGDAGVDEKYLATSK